MTLSVADSPAKTSVPLAKARALAVLEAAFGTSTCESSANTPPISSLSKTWLAAPSDGLISSEATWGGRVTKAYRSRLALLMSELRTFENGSSLLPTPTASTYGSNQGGASGRTGQIRMSLATLARTGNLLLPTPTCRDAGSAGPAELNRRTVHLRALAKYGLLKLPTPRADDGRQGRARPSATTARRVAEGRATLGEYIQEHPVLLGTPTATANQLMPSMAKWPSCAAWQAIHPPGPLLPSFVEWMMGFPYDWTIVPRGSKP